MGVLDIVLRINYNCDELMGCALQRDWRPGEAGGGRRVELREDKRTAPLPFPKIF